MHLDNRCNTLLKQILLTPTMKSSELEKKFNLTRRQVAYSLQKINDWLQFNGLPIIERTRSGHFVIDPYVYEKFPDYRDTTSMQTYVPSKEERANLIILILLTRQEEVALIHFTSALDVSKNTVLQDIKIAEKTAETYGTTLLYMRSKGYFIDGGEFDKRRLLIDSVRATLAMPGGGEWVERVADISRARLLALRDKFEKVEAYLQRRFTDERLNELPYLLSAIFRRIKMGKIVEDFHINYRDISDTREYQIAEELFSDEESLPEQERLFITLQLLATNVSSSVLLTDDDIPNLVNALHRMLYAFESMACVQLKDKEQLIDKLLLHVKPAYYRMKYNLQLDNPLTEMIENEYGELHHLVTRASEPLAELVGQRIPNGELAYLTMLIGGWLSRQGDQLQKRKRAIVVCPNGVSVSKLLYSRLKSLFPDLLFLDNVSVREFYDCPLDFDVVFSTTLLETDKKLFLVKPFFTEKEQQAFKNMVEKELFGFSKTRIDIARIVDIVAAHARDVRRGPLIRALDDYFSQLDANAYTVGEHSRKPPLSEVLPINNIVRRDRVATWQDGVRLAAKPLLKRGDIEPSYVEKSIAMVDEAEPYIVIAPLVAIPHAGPEDGVKRLGMSMLRLAQSVKLGAYSVQLIVCLASPDRQSHLKALMQFNNMIAEPRNVERLIRAKDDSEIAAMIEHYSTEQFAQLL